MKRKQKDYVITTHSKSLFNISQAPGWTSEENKVLKYALLKFGVGCWTKIINTGILPGKTITQLNLQTQRMLGQQSLCGLLGLRVNVDEIRRDNEQRLKQLDGSSDDDDDENDSNKVKVKKRDVDDDDDDGGGGSGGRIRRVGNDEQEGKDSSEEDVSGEQYKGNHNSSAIAYPLSTKKLFVKSGLIINDGENPTRETRLKLAHYYKMKYGHTEEQANSIVSDIHLYSVKRSKRLQFYNFLKQYLKQKGNLQSEDQKLCESDMRRIDDDDDDEVLMKELKRELQQIKHEARRTEKEMSRLYGISGITANGDDENKEIVESESEDYLDAENSLSFEETKASTRSQPSRKKRRT